MLERSFSVLLMLLLACLSLSLAQQYQIINSRQSSPGFENIITLRCRNTINFQTLLTAQFFVNDTNLNSIVDLQVNHVDQGEITFVITRELEGQYTCGEDIFTRSNHEEIIALPTDKEVGSKTVTFKVGEQAQLPPLVSPGALLQRYYIDWLRDDNTLARVIGPRTVIPMSFDPRYRVDPVSFELLISAVRFDDRGQYDGRLGVAEGATLHDYDTGDAMLTLEVFGDPSILDGPKLQVVKPRESAMFSCRAEGYPAPEIYWVHIGHTGTTNRIDRSTNRYIYSSSTTDVSSDSEDLPVTESFLEIIDTNTDDIGTVTCFASTDFEEAFPPVTVQSQTSLSVLGAVIVDPVVTIKQQVFLIITLPAALEVGLRLFIKYTDENGAITNVTDSDVFMRTKEITHLEQKAPFGKFRVQVGLMYREELGELSSVSELIDSSTPTDLEQILIQYMTPSVAGIIAAVIIATTIISIFCCWQGYQCCAKCCRKNPKANSKVVKKIFGHDVQTLEELLGELNRWRESEHKLSDPGPHGPPIPPSREVSREESCFSRLCCATEKHKRAKRNFRNVRTLLSSLGKTPATDQVMDMPDGGQPVELVRYSQLTAAPNNQEIPHSTKCWDDNGSYTRALENEYSNGEIMKIDEGELYELQTASQ